MSPVTGGLEPQGSTERWFGRIVSKVRNLIARWPEGYQDEEGFHYGKPAHPTNYF